MNTYNLYIDRNRVIPILFLFLLILLSTWLYNIYFFENIAKLFVIALSYGIFVLVWNYNKLVENSFFNYLGSAFFFIGTLKLFAFLSIKKQGIFHSDETILSYMFETTAHYIEALTFITVPFFINRKLKFNRIFIIFLILLVISMFSIVYLVKYLINQPYAVSLNYLNILSLYLIPALYLLSIVTLIIKRHVIEGNIVSLFVVSLFLKLVKELYFFPKGATIDMESITSYFMEIVSLYLIYKAFLDSGIFMSYDKLVATLKQSEASLRYEKDFAENLIESAGVIVLVLDSAGNIVQFNSYMETLTGFKIADMKGKNFFKHFLPSNIIEQYKDKFFAPDTINQSIIIPILTHNNERRYIEWFNRPLKNAEIKSMKEGFLAVGHDITERRNAEAFLRESEQKYRTIINTTSEGFWLLTPELVTIDVNDSLCKMLGYGRHEFINRKPFDFIAKESLIKYYDKVKQIPTTTQRVYELIFNKKDGKPLYAIINATTIIDNTGQPSTVFTFITDITRHKQLEKNLRESEERFRALSEATFEGIAIVKGKKIVETNSMFSNMFGYEQREIIGMKLSDFIYADYHNNIIGECDCNNHIHCESIGLKKDNTKFNIEICGKNMYYMGVAARVYAIRNISRFKDAEEQIKKSLKEKEMFLREIHHRIKNNLQIIISLLNLQSLYISDTKTLEVFQESKNRIKAISLIHERLYQSQDVSKISTKDYVIKLVSSITRSYGLDNRKIKLTFNVEDFLLGIDTAIPCGLIINELISNAMKYAFSKDMEGEIIISFKEKESESYELIVEDNGIGLPPGFNFKTTKNALGLQLVNDLVESQLEGDIKLESTAGTCFIINFKEVKYQDRI
ncbi:MAG: PAS domain S-box protein [Candidatus Magnetoovum sp. WYHC-5]|nr:PAS domain S-box protein [Candidatus Magnetoovum sp. WYHC-5]